MKELQNLREGKVKSRSTWDYFGPKSQIFSKNLSGKTAFFSRKSLRNKTEDLFDRFSRGLPLQNLREGKVKSRST